MYVDTHKPRLNIGRWPKHVLANGPGAADVAIKRGLDAGYAVDLRARFSGQAVRDFLLHHHQHAANRGKLRQQMQKHRHGHVIRQVGYQGSWLLIHVPAHHLQRILINHRQAVSVFGHALLNRLWKATGQARVDL